ncbi:phage tail fiber protein [Proteus terrae]|uniref:Phage tail protein C-terminal domain-containing protein n=1 Tax=Proteus terrae subsp. cibarius TaxID=626774 RepID=A0A8I0WVY4_9GAMM|nr:hypothetical protein [Proteus terrae]MBG2916146.1 hypothetical protein [Proteus terrae subsp. cibarius]
MIYTTGTVNTVSGSAIVKGTGTKFKNNNPAINIGMTILIKSGNTNIPYMIKSVNSDTELVLAQPALATATNTAFSIHITEPDNNSDAARTMVAINSYTQYFLDAMNTWMTQTGQTKVEMPNGEIVTLDSIKKMQEDIGKKFDKSGGSIHGRVAVKARIGEKLALHDTLSNSANYLSLYSGEPEVRDAFIGFGSNETKTLTIRNDRDDANLFINKGGLAHNGNPVILQGDFGVGKNTKYGWVSNQGPGDTFVKLANIEGGPNNRGTFFITSASSGYGDTSDRTASLAWVNVTIGNGNGANNCNARLVLSDHSGSISISDLRARMIDNTRTKWELWIRVKQYSKVLCYYFGDITKVEIPANEIADDIPIESGKTYSKPTVISYTNENTSVDPQGFIKKASPIINIQPDGTFTTNDESENATVTRIAQGAYLIKGVLGFNADAGWGGVDGGIEIPLDVNKQPLIWVNSKVMEDGSILVKTYHRTHPNAPKFARNDIDGFNDSDPIDIPAGRFISVRVQMPEQSIYNVRMREMEEAQKAEEERRQQEEEMKVPCNFGGGDKLL